MCGCAAACWIRRAGSAAQEPVTFHPSKHLLPRIPYQKSGVVSNFHYSLITIYTHLHHYSYILFTIFSNIQTPIQLTNFHYYPITSPLLFLTKRRAKHSRRLGNNQTHLTSSRKVIAPLALSALNLCNYSCGADMTKQQFPLFRNMSSVSLTSGWQYSH